MGMQDFYGDQLAYGGALLIEPIDYALGNLFGTVYESFDPAGVPSADVRLVPEKHFYVKGGITAGNRDPYQQDPNGLHFVIDNAAVTVSEAGVLIDQDPNRDQKNYPGHYKVGGIYNGGNFKNPVTGQVSSGNYLTYYMAQQAVYRRAANSNRGLDLFGTYDYSPNDVNKVNSETTAGGRYTGLFASRPKDTLAFGYVLSKVSSHFNLAYFQEGLPLLGSEKAYEVSYLFQVTPWLIVQPDFQHYVDVGANSHIPNATVLGFRTKVTF
jgi:carbohydrate-selective porin OprB